MRESYPSCAGQAMISLHPAANDNFFDGGYWWTECYLEAIERAQSVVVEFPRKRVRGVLGPVDDDGA